MAALLVLSARIAFVYKKNILDIIALSSAGLMMLMYLLSFFRGLKLTGPLAAVVIVAVLAWTALSSRKGSGFGKELFAVGKELLNPVVILFVLTVTGVGFAISDHIFTWWDDINFWAADAKQLFFLNGFPGKYGNASPEFGDYPPVTSLAKWLFLQISPRKYREGLQFVGYFWINGVFLLPLLARMQEAINGSELKKPGKLLAQILSFAAVMLLPGVFNGIIYYGTPSDITMAIIYGALLLTIYDQSAHGKIFYYVRIGLFVAVLLLTKNVAAEWALFALVFYFVMAKREKYIWLSVLGGGAALGSWLMFCLLNRRVAKLTGEGIRMATSGKYRAPENTLDKMRYFFEGFARQPMHADHNLTLDLSTGFAVVLIFAAIALLYYRNILGRHEVKRIAVFTLLTGILTYGIVFFAHISIFQGEVQYLDAYAMAVSIARYCAPFSIGTTYLLMGILFGRLRAKGSKEFLGGLAICLLLIFVTADYAGAWKYLYGYRETLSEDQAYYDDMVGDEGRELLRAVDDSQYWGKRILVLRDGHSYYWVHNAYISKSASPVALVYNEFLTESDTAETMIQKIKESHASSIYVEDGEGISRKLFSEVLSDDGFEPGRVYKTEGIIY